jgi:hypothetical protein
MKILICSLVVACTVSEAIAYDREFTSMASEKVARQRLLSFGLTDVEALRLTEEGRWIASASLAGRRIEIEIDSMTGRIAELGRADGLSSVGPPEVPIVRPHSIAGHDDDLRSGDLPPRTALVSEEVARQTLASYGLSHVQELRIIDQSRWVASAILAGRRIEIEIDAITGRVTERGRNQPLQPVEQPGVPLMRDHSIKLERSDIARMPTIIEPFAPKRPSTVRP